MTNFDPRNDLVVVIMAGGSGKRFWPLSTEAKPKQFLSLFGHDTMLQLTWKRLEGLVPPERVLVLTNGRFVDLVAEQLPQLPRQNIIGEPMPRDTSGAIGLAATLCQARFGDPVMAVLTADHLIRPVEAFQATLLSAARGARESAALYTFGVVPTFPSTAYGYLEAGDKVADDGGVEHFELCGFREKPDAQTARRFITSGRYSWNSGMFVWNTHTIWGAMERLLPEHTRHLEPLAEADGTRRWNAALYEAFEPLPKISIDFGVMEQAELVRMVRAEFEWSDVGGWLALEQFHAVGPADNRGRGQLHCLQSTNNFVFSEDENETIALVGVRDLVVVRAEDRTMVVHRAAVESVKDLVNLMKEK